MVVEWKEAASAVYDLISLLLNDEISAVKGRIKSKISEKRHRTKIRKFCVEYMRKNNGTVITNPVFSQWLKNDGTIDRLFKYSGSTHVSQTDAEYIESELLRIKDNIEYPINALDLSAIKGFLIGLLKEHRKYREKHLSNDSKQIIQNGDRNAKVIQNSIESQNQDIKNILFLVSNKNELSLSEAFGVYQTLDDCFWKGDFTLLVNILPMLHDKSSCLEIWLSLILNIVLLDGEKYCTDYSVMDIEHPRMRKDAIRKQVIFKYLKDGNLKNTNYEADGELGELIDKLKNGDDWLFNERKEIKDNVECYTLEPIYLFSEEKETINTLQIINVYRKNYVGVANVINAIVLNSKKNFLTELLKDVKQYTEAITICEKEEQGVKLSEHIISELWNKKDIYSGTSAIIQSIYWKTMLQAFAISNKSKIAEVIQSIPSIIQEELSDIILMARLRNNDVTEYEIVSYWNKEKSINVLSSYIVSLDSVMAVKFVRQKTPDAMGYPEIVLTLVALLLRDNENDEAVVLLEEREDICIDYAEYYVDRIQISRNQEYVVTLADKWEQRDLKYINHQTDSIIAQIMYDWKRFDMCLKLLKSLEIKGIDNGELRKLKGFALINSGKVVEGLAVLNDLIPEKQNDISVVGNILNFSLGLQREVSDTVIMAAEKMSSPEIMLDLAVVFEQRGNIQNAKKYYWKALLSNRDDKSKIYGMYWNFVIKHFNGDGKVENSDEDTCIYAKIIDGDERIVIGILGKEYVEEEMHIGGITIVSTENAIRRGWYNKKVGANILFEDNTYVISEINNIEMCLSRMCCEKLVKTGVAKAISMPQDLTPEQMRAHLISFIKSNVLQSNKGKGLFDDYTNLSQLPLTLYGLSNCFNSTITVFIYRLIKDSTILVREWINYDISNSEKPAGYVLSISALILLFLLQVPAELLKNNNVYIPQSMLMQIRNEKEIVISENRCDAGTLSVVDDQLRILTDSDETKQELMTFVIDLLEYAEKIPSIEGKKDFVIDNLPELQLRSLIGTSDLDSLSICAEHGYSLVSFEVWLSDINMLSGHQNVTVLELLNAIERDDLTFLDYIKKCIQFRMMSILDKESLKRIAKSKKSETLESWKQFIGLIENQDTNYRNWLREHLTHVNQKYQEERDENLALNDVERLFFNLLMELLEREVHVSTDTLRDEEGNVVLRTYMRVYDKKQQRYLEGLDRIVDTVIQIELPPSQEDDETKE